MTEHPTTVHAGPPFGSAVTNCCNRSPLELPRDHRVTYNLGDVTCGRPERQTWELRRLADHTDLALHLEVDAEGRVRIHEAVLARVLTEAGWERTA